jgi:deazaflavin-dependent oxidoreductase (nitroreductase family)
MTDPVIMALARGGMVEITTVGKRSGTPHRARVGLHNVDRQLIISGQPGKRDWLANLLANPRFTIHLHEADVPATATPVTDWAERRALIERFMVDGHGFAPERARCDLPLWVARSPLVKVTAKWPGLV